MSFIKNLQWRNSFEQFSPDEQRVLLALSDSRYLWRTLDRLQSVTRLSSPALIDTLDHLIELGWIRASVSRSRKEPVLGLVERVGEGRQLRQVG